MNIMFDSLSTASNTQRIPYVAISCDTGVAQSSKGAQYVCLTSSFIRKAEMYRLNQRLKRLGGKV